MEDECLKVGLLHTVVIYVLAFVTLIVLVYVYIEDDCLEAGLLLWILQLPTSLLIWTVFLPLRRSIDIP